MATVTTHYDSDSGKKVWSIGGEIAEDGHKENPNKLKKNLVSLGVIFRADQHNL